MSPTELPHLRALTNALKAEALRLGFDAVGVAAAVAPPGYAFYRDWLSRGFAAGMGYLETRAAARAHPDAILDGVRSLVMVAISYQGVEAVAEEPERGKVARYARGTDYHQILWRRLEQLLDWLRGRCPAVRGRAVADTAPLLERDFARLSGLGWIGKNTMLINKSIGSHTVLGALLVDIELEPDDPHFPNHCGTCTRCLEACPTDAFAGPRQLDARKCLSYWTIEHRGHVPSEIAEQLDGWVFGCDICQEVCPWNRKALPGRLPELQPRPEGSHPNLIAWLDASDADLAGAVKGTALKRAKRGGLLRNAALVLGQRRVFAALEALTRRLRDPDPVVRAACAWALGRLGTSRARAVLEAARNDEDPTVRDAIRGALGEESGMAFNSESSETSPASAAGSPPDPE